MKCPYCGYLEDKVIDSRPTDEYSAIRRRRECNRCMRRFTTYEKVESIPLMVIKKDKTRQPFDREKLINGLLRACEKRPVSVDTLEKLADEIELQILNSLKREITTKEIGEMVMARLKDIDEVAYVRFASVYRQFKDINTFMEELHKLLKENEKLQENEQQEENGQDDHK
ncbi:MAG TPA: transcriptional regulator NrdR [Clostridiales bacterium]|nr:transcriptional regulator NrdR [Clostridiales bacterium]HPP35406.1 transcriptional regulator NrdR [Clostridiales bacterium]